MALGNLRAKKLAAFAVIYLVWGSTYLAIRWAVAAIPPLLMAGSRFLVAGVLLWLVAGTLGPSRMQPLWQRLRPNIGRRDLLLSAAIGFLMLLAGNGFLSLAETSAMPTGVAALLIASVPLWMVILEAITGTRPTVIAGFGLVLGFAGVAVLAGHQGTGGPVDMRYVVLVLLGSAAWAAGSLVSRVAALKLPMLQAVALQMMLGGMLLLVFGWLRGEHVTWSQVTWRAAASWLYLVLFGSVLAFTAYSWLLQTVPAGLATTYAFVNPLVAVVIGSLVLQESITRTTLTAAALIVGAVATITYARSRAAKRQVARETPPAA